MSIPETPLFVQDLDLMKRLYAYVNDEATWHADGTKLGSKARQACNTLYNNLVNLTQIVAPILDRSTAREMQTFTMHDREHGQKVAHLMWHILKPERREVLTPPEIALMIFAAYIHDLGMSLTNQEREERLIDEEFWFRLEINENQKQVYESLREKSMDAELPEDAQLQARRGLMQIEEALLCQDTRDRHATIERYKQVLSSLEHYHQQNPENIPDIRSCLSYGGDSFYTKLIDICVSHNEEASVLGARDPHNYDRERFPRNLVIGGSKADLQMIAASLRLADILDFDRERTPTVMYYYLLPDTHNLDDRSVIEWGKHMAISKWDIKVESIVFEGNCNSHIIHHAIEQFCGLIQSEIERTRLIFGEKAEEWPFVLPSSVKTNIDAEGYKYLPYRFELDDQRVYQLLMGGAIYDNALVAVRELVQNAVDACKVKDAQVRLRQDGTEPTPNNRIIIQYFEAQVENGIPTLIISDKGCGMNKYTLEEYFLKVGRSYYNSADFNRMRLELRRVNEEWDFAPVSEFGIGFLSCFLLADDVEVETSKSDDDVRIRRHLQINGPTRLIRIIEEPAKKFTGTRITLKLVRGSMDDKNKPPSWEEIELYLRDICQDLPYSLELENILANGQSVHSRIEPGTQDLRAYVPAAFEDLTVHIPVKDDDLGLEGDIAFLHPYKYAQLLKDKAAKQPQVSIWHEDNNQPPEFNIHLRSELLRAGFKVGEIPSAFNFSYPLPSAGEIFSSRLRLTWRSRLNRRYLSPNLARSNISDMELIFRSTTRAWIEYLLQNIDSLPEGSLYGLNYFPYRHQARYVQDWNLRDERWLENFDALTLYRLASSTWQIELSQNGFGENLISQWEQGEPIRLPLALNSSESNAFRYFLYIILPQITLPQIDSTGVFYVKPPTPNWTSQLASWNTFITKPAKWDKYFIEYVGDIQDFLIWEPGLGFFEDEPFNSYFRPRLATFSDDDLKLLQHSLTMLTRIAENEKVTLTTQVFGMLQTARELLGDLYVGSGTGTDLRKWLVGSINIPDI